MSPAQCCDKATEKVICVLLYLSTVVRDLHSTVHTPSSATDAAVDNELARPADTIDIKRSRR